VSMASCEATRVELFPSPQPPAPLAPHWDTREEQWTLLLDSLLPLASGPEHSDDVQELLLRLLKVSRRAEPVASASIDYDLVACDVLSEAWLQCRVSIAVGRR